MFHNRCCDENENAFIKYMYGRRGRKSLLIFHLSPTLYFKSYNVLCISFEGQNNKMISKCLQVNAVIIPLLKSRNWDVLRGLLKILLVIHATVCAEVRLQSIHSGRVENSRVGSEWQECLSKPSIILSTLFLTILAMGCCFRFTGKQGRVMSRRGKINNKA